MRRSQTQNHEVSGPARIPLEMLARPIMILLLFGSETRVFPLAPAMGASLPMVEMPGSILGNAHRVPFAPDVWILAAWNASLRQGEVWPERS